jgi:hypothetical protein
VAAPGGAGGAGEIAPPMTLPGMPGAMTSTAPALPEAPGTRGAVPGAAATGPAPTTGPRP